MTLELPPVAGSAAISGTLKDGYGTPADHVGLTFSVPGGSGGGTTDSFGHFQFEVPTGQGTLYFNAGSAAYVNPVRMPANWNYAAPMSVSRDTVVDLVLPRVVELAVHVIEVDGAPVTGARVTVSGDSLVAFEGLTGRGYGINGWSQTDSLGNARFVLFPSAKILSIYAEQVITNPYYFVRHVDIRGISALRDTVITFVLPPLSGLAVISGTLKDGYGTPVDHVDFAYQAPSGSVTAETDAVGRFRLEVPLGEGVLSLNAGAVARLNPNRMPQSWYYSAPVTLTRNLVLDLELPHVIDLTVRVLEVDGSPVKDSGVAMSGSAWQFSWTTAPIWTYRLLGRLPPD